jgi:cell division protein FtsI (penicillin-binding protein 3)
MRVRVWLMGAVFLAGLVAVFTRAVALQVHQNDRLREMARDQYIREVEIAARRGDIVDRVGAPLAQSVDVDSIWADPTELSELKSSAKELAKALGLDAKDLRERFEKAKRFVWVKRQAKPEEVAKVKALGLSGIGFSKEPRRFYPQRELAGHVVGLVGKEGKGLDGLELAFEEELSGQAVRREGFRDAKGRKLVTQRLDDAALRSGATLTLTLDGRIQYMAEKALARAVDDAKATAGMAVVLDPKTGELLALANFPQLNPNTPNEAHAEAFRNRSVTDAFEPGSTFKAFVVAAALEEKVISESSLFDCENGAWRVGRHTINDTHPHEILTPGKILQVSSNIGAAKIGQKLGRERFVDYSARFGFGDRLGLGMPGEGKGVVPFPKAEISLVTESFGQGLTATAVQLASAYGALANGGVLMRPYLVSKVADPDGLVILENQPTALRRVVSQRTANSVVSMLEAVVEKGGSGTKARMDQYRVSGKTGTSQKADPVARGYSDKRIASFIGMVPAENPRVVVLVVIDEPKTDVYGGLVAAPAFKEIATAAMPYLGVLPSRTAPEVATAKNLAKVEEVNDRTTNPVLAAIANLDTVTENGISEGAVRVPDLSGKSARKAVAQLLATTLEPHLSGTGRVKSQQPRAGALVDKGTRVTLELAGQLH